METSKLNQTFIPKEILKKTEIANQNAVLSAHSFQNTGGNPYIQFDPVEVKFNGYELGKTQTVLVRIINKSPIPQRVHILPPTEAGFSVRVNKKGPIAAGMSENIQVSFTSDVYKYQYDVVKVNSETGNFVIPIYAYPSIPKMQQIFPKIVDFGSVPVNESNSFLYPINNPVPLDFTYEFNYIQQSTAFIITPIRGTIAANSTENIEVTFIPSEKKTFVAEVMFQINQFDFQPIRIKIFGSGQQKKQALGSTRRIKSSKLNPLLKTQSKKIQPVAELENVKALDLGNTSQKKSFVRSRTSYPKLLKKGATLNNAALSMTQVDKLQTTIKKESQRQYNNQFSKIQQLDKQKEIKFVQYLGNHAMSEEELDFEKRLTSETQKTRMQNFREYCANRHEPELKNDAQIDLSKVQPQTVTWNINKNNQLKIRKEKLHMFMRAGSKLIIQFRLLKRLGKIQQFLKDCKSKQDVRKKVEEDYAKSRDASLLGKTKVTGKFTFSLDMLQASSFPLQFKDETESIKKIFETEGSTKFDDDKVLEQIKRHETEALNYGNLAFPSDFIYLTKTIPQARQSAEQQYPLKTSALPDYKPIQPSSVYKLPLKVPNHQFIYNNFEFMRYKTANPVDERDPEYLIGSTLENIEDQFEGWSKGDMEVLKTKFQRNMGCQFEGISLYNYPEIGDIGFLGELGGHLPKEIGNLEITKDDILQQGDSDEEKIPNADVQQSDVLLAKIEQTNPKAKERRQKGQFLSYQNSLMSTMERNLQKIKIKQLSTAIDKISEYNKWAQKKANRVLI